MNPRCGISKLAMSRSTMYRNRGLPGAGWATSATGARPGVSNTSRTVKTMPPQTPLLASPIAIRPTPGRSNERAGSGGKLFVKWRPLTLGVKPGTRSEVATGTDARVIAVTPPGPIDPEAIGAPVDEVLCPADEGDFGGVVASFVARYEPWPIPESTRSVVSMSGRAGRIVGFVAARVRATASTVAMM